MHRSGELASVFEKWKIQLEHHVLSLMQGLLSFLPKDRLTLHSALQHPYFADFSHAPLATADCSFIAHAAGNTGTASMVAAAGDTCYDSIELTSSGASAFLVDATTASLAQRNLVPSAAIECTSNVDTTGDADEQLNGSVMSPAANKCPGPLFGF